MGTSSVDASAAAVIGHRGMVGSAIAAYLSERGPVVGIDRASYESYRGHHFRMIVNANGSSDKRAAARAPLRDFAANVESVARTLEDLTCDHYVLISSVDVYPDVSDRDRTSEAERPDPFRLTAYGLHKHLAEILVRRHAPSWTVFRLGPIVGPGLRKNAIFDLLTARTLFVNPRSTYPFIDTRAVARIVGQLAQKSGEVFNVCGLGDVELATVARRLAIVLPPGVHELPEEHYRIDVRKVTAEVAVPDSLDAVLAFASETAGP